MKIFSAFASSKLNNGKKSLKDQRSDDMNQFHVSKIWLYHIFTWELRENVESPLQCLTKKSLKKLKLIVLKLINSNRFYYSSRVCRASVRNRSTVSTRPPICNMNRQKINYRVQNFSIHTLCGCSHSECLNTVGSLLPPNCK